MRTFEMTDLGVTLFLVALDKLPNVCASISL